MKLIEEIEAELIKLGFRQMSIDTVPDVITRVEITIRIAYLYYCHEHVLSESDRKWCEYYSHYVHFFDLEKFQYLGDLYFNLTEQMEKDGCFDGLKYQSS